MSTTLVPSTKKIKPPLAIKEVASKLKVTDTTVRNWIKTGYLTVTDDNRIDADSVTRFEQRVAGIDKLNLRANKTQRDKHDHGKIQSEFSRQIGELDSRELDSAGFAYEQALSNSYRNQEGIYYTPQDVVDDFFTYPLEFTKDTKFLDPCCGSGNFLLKALELGCLPENLYGFDTDPVAVEICRTRIHRKAGVVPQNIIYADFIQTAIDENDLPSFDVIYTNPPWGKKIPTDLKQELKRRIGRDRNAAKENIGSTDTSSLFLFCCLEQLSDNGCIGFLMPDAFFNIAAFGDARKKLLEYQLLRITDYGKPFKSLMTGATGFIARKPTLAKSKSADDYVVDCHVGKLIHQRAQASFLANPKTIINHQVNASQSDVINHLLAVNHVSLRSNATWALGIVTGNNKKHLAKNPADNLIAVHKGADISASGLAKATNFISRDFSKFQQVAPAEIYNADEKIVYKFISSNLCFYRDTHKSIFLNSANMFVLHPSFALNHTQLVWLMNTDLMNWLFKHLFSTHKVLRTDLETLPIFHEYLRQNKNYTEDGLLCYLGIEKAEGTYRLTKRKR